MAGGLNGGDRRVRLPVQPNWSLIGGLECLERLVALSRPVGSRELARQLAMEHTRVSRLLGTLAHLGMVEQTVDRRYVPGAGLHVLAAMSLRGSRLLAQALPHLRLLKEQEPDCSIALGVLWRSHVCYLFFGAPGRPLEEGIANCAPYGAELSSIGQVLLAARTQAEIREFFKTREGGLSAAGMDRLLKTLGEVRQRGYAVAGDSSITVGVAVGDPPFAGIAAAGDIDKRRIPALVSRLKTAAAAVSEAMKNSGGNN